MKLNLTIISVILQETLESKKKKNQISAVLIFFEFLFLALSLLTQHKHLFQIKKIIPHKNLFLLLFSLFSTIILNVSFTRSTTLEPFTFDMANE